MEMITKDFIDEFRRFADNEVHPVVSPDNWHIYSRLIDFIDELDESLKEQEQEAVSVDNGKCPSCNWDFENGELDFSNINESRFYCPRCGQAVKFDD